MKQLDFLEAAHERDAGIAQAADHAGEDWQTEALDAFRRYATTHETFLTEDVRMACDLPLPPHNRAWGAVAQKASKRGYVVQDGFGYARQSHLSPVVRWKSLVFKR